MAKYLSVFFILIIAITGFILCFNPRMHKNLSIADSDSKVSMENKDYIKDNKENVANRDNIKAAGTKFKNIDNINTRNAGFKNYDNINNVDANISPADNLSNEGGIEVSNNENISPYVQQIREREGWKEPVYEEPAPEIVEPVVPQPVQQPRRLPRRPASVVENPGAVRNTAPQVIQQEQPQSREETISWNIWRSNLGNYIADDSGKWASVNGTYMFYFTVDNQRQISNPVIVIMGMASNEARMAAYRYLYNLSGSQILEFPSGSKRKSVNAVYAIHIDDNIEDSSLNSSDFSDYERIR